MKLQQLIDEHELDITLKDIKAFFLGVMCADRPLPFNKALEELFSAAPEMIEPLKDEMQLFWDELQKNKPYELQKMFQEKADLNEYLAESKEQLDIFLTALSLSGTNVESCKNEDVADLIDELEDTVMDLDEYLSEEDADKEEGEELKAMLIETWLDYLHTSKQ